LVRARLVALKALQAQVNQLALNNPLVFPIQQVPAPAVMALNPPAGGVVPPAAAGAAPVVAPGHVINPYTVKLNPFNVHDVKTWLTMSELHTSPLDGFGKYVVVTRYLPDEVTSQISDLLSRHAIPVLAPLVKDWDANYLELRTALVERFTESDRTALQRLLANEALGDRRPSAYMRHLQNMIRGRANIDCTAFIRHGFLEKMPDNVRSHLALHMTDTLDQWGEMADKIVEATSAASKVMAVGASASGGATAAASGAFGFEDHMLSMVNAIKALTSQLDQLKTDVHEVKQERGRSQSRGPGNRGRSPSAGRSFDQRVNANYCWYHDRWAEDAKQCKGPCTFWEERGYPPKQAKQPPKPTANPPTAPVNYAAAATPVPVQQTVSLADLQSILAGMGLTQVPAQNQGNLSGL